MMPAPSWAEASGAGVPTCDESIYLPRFDGQTGPIAVVRCTLRPGHGPDHGVSGLAYVVVDGRPIRVTLTWSTAP